MASIGVKLVDRSESPHSHRIPGSPARFSTNHDLPAPGTRPAHIFHISSSASRHYVVNTTMVQQHPEVFLQAVAIDQEVDSPPASLAVAYAVEAAPFPAPGSSSLVTVPTGNATYITPSSVPMWQQAKQGAKCCGFCCDYRRAVFILSIIGLCVSMISILFLSVASSLSMAETLATTDDNQDEVLEAELRSNSILFNAFLLLMGILAAICALVGAWKFNMWLVGINVVWLVGKYHYSHRCNHGFHMMFGPSPSIRSLFVD